MVYEMQSAIDTKHGVLLKQINTVTPLYNDIRYNSKIHYNVNSVDSNKYPKRMIYGKKNCSKVSVIHALDGSLSSFFITANSILRQDLW